MKQPIMPSTRLNIIHEVRPATSADFEQALEIAHAICDPQSGRRGRRRTDDLVGDLVASIGKSVPEDERRALIRRCIAQMVIRDRVEQVLSMPASLDAVLPLLDALRLAGVSLRDLAIACREAGVKNASAATIHRRLRSHHGKNTPKHA